MELKKEEGYYWRKLQGVRENNKKLKDTIEKEIIN